jgi:hypothetical protein
MDRKSNLQGALMTALFFLIGRFLLLLSLPLEGIRSYGDFWNFYHLASLGQPFRDLWVEFPPVFPYLSRGLYLLVDGRQHAYEYLLAFFLSFVQAANLFLFSRIVDQIWKPEIAQKKIGAYLVFLIGLFYGWTYFDPLVVLAVLGSLYGLIRDRDLPLGFSLSLGALTKWFPLMILPALWKWRPRRKALLITLLVVVLVGGVWGGLYLRSPEMTRASLLSQGVKGSWETVWALLDGNLKTGNFGPGIDRADPATILTGSSEPARVPPWLTLMLIGGAGFVWYTRVEPHTPDQLVALAGFTIGMFLLWSPGYSPQWVLYLLPLILIAFPVREGFLLALVLILLNLLEWPVLLSRGLFWSLWFVVPLRTLMVVLASVRFYQLAAGLGSRDENHVKIDARV